MNTLKKILLIEDDPFDAELTQKALKEILIANEILWMETGQEFLDYLDEYGTTDIGVAILDLNMPMVSGLEALEAIRQKDYDHFPIVILSSSKEYPDVEASYKLGVNSFVTKPVRTAAFHETIRTLGLYWGILNEIP